MTPPDPDDTNQGQQATTWQVGGQALTIIADRYELRDRIGQGAAGEVFEAMDTRLGRLVAIKTVPLRATNPEAALRALGEFQHEARAASRLSHPGIVTIHDFGNTDSYAWLVMELVIGENLRNALDSNGAPALAEAVRITRALLDALGYAHGRGLVHRDVKPGNILLSVGIDPGWGQVRLAAFGIAHIGVVDAAPDQGPPGSPTVMAPEQVNGAAVDHRADLWAAGVILYELLTGKRPFTGGYPAIFDAILSSEPPPPSSIVPDLPPAFDAVIARALAKRAEDRFPDARAMDAAIALASLSRPASAPALDFEGMLRERLRVRLHALFDTTLEPMVDEAVRAEVRRVVGGG
ncbi:MAG: serine/threonine-protein kinase [Alphaproteobacteria bacterium]|nr:serine/threonine-protein kinase [Alphaproteobacteria bacterium]